MAQLEVEHLLRPCSGGAAADEIMADTSPRKTKTEFLPPVIAKYNDMAEMLKLDPVHEVAEQGWPEANHALPGTLDDRPEESTSSE